MHACRTSPAPVGDGCGLRGQLPRMALVSSGHLLGRLPAGNTGRPNVSALKRMDVAADLQRLLDDKLTSRVAGMHIDKHGRRVFDSRAHLRAWLLLAGVLLSAGHGLKAWVVAALYLGEQVRVTS